MEEAKLLEVANLSVHFVSDQVPVQATRAVSFALRRGETLGIVGESGSGKSVTALSCMRLLSPGARLSGGTILYHAPGEGEPAVDLLQLSEEEMRHYRGNRLAMIFQEPMTSLNPVFRCGDQVVEAIRLHRRMLPSEARREALKLLAKVRLRDPERIFQSYPHQLSGGQKQRVMIAMALSCEPDLLIADEPTTALDVTVQKAILGLLKELKDEYQLSIIFISHDLGVIGEVADRVLVMKDGRVIEAGSVQQIFQSPREKYTQGLLACRPPLAYRLRRLPTVTDFLEMDDKKGGNKDPDFFRQAIDQLKIPPQETSKRLEQLQQQQPILTVKDLRTWFVRSSNKDRYVRAVDGVDFDVFPGETLGLVGESGCGKTTLGRTILLLEQPQTGEILFRGENILEYDRLQRKSFGRQMQMVFQDPYSSLNPRMTIGSAIEEVLRVHRLCSNDRESRERTLELLALVKLDPHHYNRYPHEFSGGQRQRICIARALAADPVFLVCDESVSALDVSIQAQILNLLIDLREKFQFTTLFISHDLSVVKLMSDRILVMQEGKIIESGPADELYHNPRSPYTQRLIEAIPAGWATHQ